MKKSVPNQKIMYRIATIPTPKNYHLYVIQGNTRDARQSVMDSLTETQQNWLRGRPWEVRNAQMQSLEIHARMGKHGNFDREDLMAKLLFNG